MSQAGTEPSSTQMKSKDKPKIVLACKTCRKKKVKCSGQYPCLYCARRGLECRFPVTEDKRLLSEAKVRELQERLALYEGPTDNGGHTDTQRPITPAASGSIQMENANTARLFNAPGDGERPASLKSPTPNITSRAEGTSHQMETHFTLGSSQNFGNRVQNLLEQQSPNPSSASSMPGGPAARFTLTREALFPDRRTPLKPHQGDEGRLAADVTFPSLEHAYRLLDTVLLYLGDAQHFFDARELADQLMTFYRNGLDKSHRTSIWYLHILLVLSIGKLLRGDLDGAAGPPGFALFNEALRLMPDISEIRAHGIAGIEILALVAVYFQNIDQKDNAAAHIGLAFRLALLHKLYRQSTLDQLHPSQATHANRIWWTVQMHDKRLAIATGCPLSLDDKMIASPLPTSSPGFCDPLAIQLNISIVQIQSRIYSVIYGDESCSETRFCDTVREIISSLTATAKEIPQNASRSSISGRDRSKLGVRTSISLFTMLYQAIILTLRPALLHLAKSIFDRKTTFSASSTPIQHLARTCIDAASKNLELMLILMDEKIISVFGFFDLDAIFSSSFVLLLANVIRSADMTAASHFPFLNSNPDINAGLLLLEYLASYQNHAAQARKNQIQNLQEFLSLFAKSTHSAEMRNKDTEMPLLVSQNPDTSQYEEIMRTYTQDTMEGGFVPVTLPDEFSDDPHAIYSFFRDEGFDLTGENQADFEEAQRHFQWEAQSFLGC